jgi:hypothetical protein
MAATIVRFDRQGDTRAQEQRLLELVRDLSGAPKGLAADAFGHAPPAPADALERVAHALVHLRHHGGLRIAAYVPEVQTPPGRAADLLAIPTLGAGPSWPGQLRAQLVRARRAASTDA